MDADVVLGAGPQVGQPTFDGVAREDGPIASILALVGQENLKIDIFCFKIEFSKIGDEEQKSYS